MFDDLSMKDAAEHVGLKETTFRKIVKSGSGPKARREGRTLRFRPADLDSWSRDYEEQAYTDIAASKKQNGKRSRVKDPLS